MLVLAAPLERADGPLGRERLAPLLSLSTVDGTSQGLEVCDTVTYTNLLNTKRLARPFI